jgi:hypothetical protein
VLDVRILALAQKTSQTQIRDLDNQFSMTIDEIKAKFHGSGSMYLYVAQAYQEELGQRAAIVWRNLLRAHGSFGSPRPESLHGDLIDAFRSQLDAVTMELTPRFYKDIKGPGMSQIEKLGDARDHELARHAAEIEHYVATLEVSASRGGKQPVSYVFYGDVGAVMNGSGAVAYLVQKIGPNQREALLQAFDLVKQALAEAPDLPTRDRIELGEFVDDAATEVIREPKKNIRRLNITLQTLASAVKGIASGGPAYEALRAAATEIGIPVELPGGTRVSNRQPD